MGGLDSMFGQPDLFDAFTGKGWEDKRPRGRYVAMAKRLVGWHD